MTWPGLCDVEVLARVRLHAELSSLGVLSIHVSGYTDDPQYDGDVLCCNTVAGQWMRRRFPELDGQSITKRDAELLVHEVARECASALSR